MYQHQRQLSRGGLLEVRAPWAQLRAQMKMIYSLGYLYILFLVGLIWYIWVSLYSCCSRRSEFAPCLHSFFSSLFISSEFIVIVSGWYNYVPSNNGCTTEKGHHRGVLPLSTSHPEHTVGPLFRFWALGQNWGTKLILYLCNLAFLLLYYRFNKVVLL